MDRIGSFGVHVVVVGVVPRCYYSLASFWMTWVTCAYGNAASCCLDEKIDFGIQEIGMGNFFLPYEFYYV
jgi:hypothetical protein